MVDAETKPRCEVYRDWEVDFQEKDYYESQGAPEAQIQSLGDFAGCPLPEDYLDFLRFANGFLDLTDRLSRTDGYRFFCPRRRTLTCAASPPCLMPAYNAAGTLLTLPLR